VAAANADNEKSDFPSCWDSFHRSPLWLSISVGRTRATHETMCWGDWQVIELEIAWAPEPHIELAIAASLLIARERCAPFAREHRVRREFHHLTSDFD